MRLLPLVLMVISTLSLSARAADVEGLVDLFEQEYVSGYDDGRCQYNIRYFTAKARAQGIDLSGAIYLTVLGYGNLWYYHGRSRPGQAPTSGVWFHHYVLAIPTDGSKGAKFSPDRNYAVLDFDFGNTPKLVDLRTFLREMFMPLSARKDESRIDSTFELGLITLTGHSVTALVDQLDSSGEFPSGSESRALLFKDAKFRDFFFSLPQIELPVQ